MIPEPTIDCVECGGTCHLLTHPPADDEVDGGWLPGDIVAYRCADCLDRFDLELPDFGPSDLETPDEPE